MIASCTPSCPACPARLGADSQPRPCDPIDAEPFRNQDPTAFRLGVRDDALGHRAQRSARHAFQRVAERSRSRGPSLRRSSARTAGARCTASLREAARITCGSVGLNLHGRGSSNERVTVRLSLNRYVSLRSTAMAMLGPSSGANLAANAKSRPVMLSVAAKVRPGPTLSSGFSLTIASALTVGETGAP